MIIRSELSGLLGLVAFDESGHRVGKVGGVFLDEPTGNPEWLTVITGLFDKKQTFVPLSLVTPDKTLNGGEGGVRIAAAKDFIKDAKRIDVHEHLTVEEEKELYDYYGVEPQYPLTETEADARAAEVREETPRLVRFITGDE